MGQNFSGWARIRLTAPLGTEVTLRFAETVFPDGGIDKTIIFSDEIICVTDGIRSWR